MTEKLTEQLSALMDNECADNERSSVLQRLCEESDGLACWERYHLVGDVLKGNVPAAYEIDFADKISFMIAQEAPLESVAELAENPVENASQSTTKNMLEKLTKLVEVSQSHLRSMWYQPMAGFALAASMACVGLLGVQIWQASFSTGSTGDILRVATVPSTMAVPSVTQATAAMLATGSTDSSELSDSKLSSSPIAEKLNAYVINHHELATLSGIHGVMPYVRMVSYQAH